MLDLDMLVRKRKGTPVDIHTKLGWCEEHSHGTLCPYCEIDRLKEEAFQREARIMQYIAKNNEIMNELEKLKKALGQVGALSAD